MSSPNLQKRTALFKDLCSKLLASWCYDSAQCIAAVKDLRLQAGYSAVQMYNLEVLTVAPSPLPYYTVACINLHTPHVCHMRKGLRENSIDIVERDLQGFGFPLHLPLMLGLLKAGADNNSKAVAISQRVPDWVN